MHLFLVPHIEATKFNVHYQKHINEHVDIPTVSYAKD